jgi:hypothetical protein
MTDQNSTDNGHQDKKLSAEEALERIKEIDERETPPVKKEKTSVIIWAVVALLILLAFIATYVTAPGLFINQGFRNSSIEYRIVEETSPGVGYSVRYTLSPVGRNILLKVEYIDDYNAEFSPENVPDKVISGRMKMDAYAEFFEHLWSTARNMNKDLCSPVGGSLILKKGKEKLDLCISPDVQTEINRKFKDISDESAGKVSRTYLDKNSGIKLLAENIDSGTALNYTPGRNALMYNDSKGELFLYHLDSEHTSSIGESRLVTVNKDGLVMVIKQDNKLSIWEKRMLHNNRMTLAESWETSPKYQKVFASDKSLYYTIPAEKNGQHTLMKFDYIYYKFSPILESTEFCLQDMTSDGEHLLLQHPYGKNQLMVVNGTDETVKVKNYNLPDAVEYVHGFYRNPDEFVVVQNGSIMVWSPGKQSQVLKQGSNNEHYFPVAFNNNETVMLCLEKENNIYHMLDLEKNTSIQVNKTPMLISMPVFTEDNALFFTRYNDLLKWTPDKK